MIILLGPILLLGGALVAANGLGSFRRAGRQGWVIAGGAMMAAGALLLALVYFALRGLPGFVM